MAILIYRILFPLIFLLTLPFYALGLWKREKGRSRQEKPPGYQLGWRQRFGQVPPEIRERLQNTPAPWWLCSISVGETIIALKLARALHDRDPSVPVVISVTTSTGYELLLREAAKCPWILPIYNPLDFTFAGHATLRALRPRALVLVEGGIWPNLLLSARRQKVPIALAGARLSPRSERRWRKMKGLAREIWSMFDLVCTPEREEIPRFATIGARADRVVATGSMKFDAGTAPGPSREAEFRALLEPLGFTGPILVGGSTWAPEEKLLAATLSELRSGCPDLRLILVPRHVERSAEIAQQLAPLTVIRRSQLPAAGPADVLLVDTTGELRDWYRLGTVAFVGKSLPGVAEIGGQNPGEPALLGVPVLFGPHMENFAPIVAQLLAKGGAVQLPSADDLAPEIALLLSTPERRAALASNGQAVMAVHQGACERTAEALLRLVEA